MTSSNCSFINNMATKDGVLTAVQNSVYLDINSIFR